MLELSAEGLLAGLDRARVVRLLLARIRRDEAYLRYRRGHHPRTRYDEETEGDLRALALAACWLEEPPRRERQAATTHRKTARVGPR
jgi:hypothetical protein